MSVSHVSQDEPTRADVWTVLKELPQRVEALLKHHEASQERGFEELEQELHALFTHAECAATSEALERPVARDTPYLLPPSLQDWLPQEHLARFVVEIVDRLDLSELERAYGGRGKTPYHPAVMVALLFYGYATGVFSSRRLEQATYDSVAFRYITADTHPDHDTIAPFRKRFLEPFARAVRAGPGDCPGDGGVEDWDGEPGRDEGQGQREQAQGDELGVCEPARGAVARGGADIA